MSTKCRPRKKQKKKPKEEPPPLWTTLESIPPEPPVRLVDLGFTTFVDGKEVPYQTESRWEIDQYRARLGESLLKAAREGNTDFVRNLLQTPRTRSCLCITKHTPQTNFHDGRYTLYEMTGGKPPVQPNFGLQDLIWRASGGHPQRWNLVVEAAKNNQLETVQELVKLGFDINAFFTRNCSFYTHPLMSAIDSGSLEVFNFLLQQPNVYVTHPATKIYPHGNYRSRPRCEPTALSTAADKGMLEVVQKLIQHGALQVSSTRRSDDPYHLGELDAKQLVGFSIKEALSTAYNKADPTASCQQCIRTHGASAQTYADIVELLLSKTGTQENNVVAVFVVDRIMKKCWSDSRSETYNYSCHIKDDQDFDLRTGEPSARARAVARGLRPPHKDMLRGGANPDGPLFLQEKYQQWSQLVAKCRELLTEAGPSWRKAVDEAVAARSLDVQSAIGKTQMLLWCHLFSAPWSKGRHSCFPSTTREYAKALLHIGSSLDLLHGLEGGLKELWDKEILSYVVE